MTTLDWAVLIFYLVAIVAFGLYAGRGNRKLDDFFLAGRSMRWWAVGLSVMATQISAITFVGTTGQAYTDGMRFLVVYFGLPFAMVILCVTLVPFFYRSGVFTAYEYLERRFDARTRTLTSLLFLLSRGLAVGVTLYAPSLVLAVILGWSERSTILVMGGYHHRLRALRRQQIGDLDRRGADGDHLVRHLRVSRRRHRATCRRTSRCATRWRWRKRPAAPA